jgi:hypothetical protein
MAAGLVASAGCGSETVTSSPTESVTATGTETDIDIVETAVGNSRSGPSFTYYPKCTPAGSHLWDCAGRFIANSTGLGDTLFSIAFYDSSQRDQVIVLPAGSESQEGGREVTCSVQPDRCLELLKASGEVVPATHQSVNPGSE